MLLVEPDAGGQTRTATMTLPRGADNDIGSAPSIEPRLRACQRAMDEKLFPEASRCAAWRQEASGRQEKGSIPDAADLLSAAATPGRRMTTRLRRNPTPGMSSEEDREDAAPSEPNAGYVKKIRPVVSRVSAPTGVQS